MSPPSAYSPSAKGDDEEASQRASSDRGKAPEIVGVAPQDDSRAAGYMGEKPLQKRTVQAEFYSTLSRILFRRPIRLRSPVNGPSRQEGLCYRCPLSNRRRRIIYWKRCKVPPLWMSTVPIWVR